MKQGRQHRALFDARIRGDDWFGQVRASGDARGEAAVEHVVVHLM